MTTQTKNSKPKKWYPRKYYKDHYKDFMPGEILIGTTTYHDELMNENRMLFLFAIGRKKTNGRFFEYYNHFSTREFSLDPNEKDEELRLYRPLSLNKDYVQPKNVQLIRGTYQTLCAIIRHDIINGFQQKYYFMKKGLTDYEDYYKNFQIIQQEIRDNYGNFFRVDDKIGYLLYATSTDEDYYFVYITEDFSIQCMTAVGGYEFVPREKAPKKLQKMFYDDIKPETQLRVQEAILHSLIGSAEVIFSQINWEFADKYFLSLLRTAGILYNKEDYNTRTDIINK
jgi:hypothetical protein